MKKINNIILISAAVLGLSSCSLHDDTELFSEPAAERVEKSVAADKTLLESASNGWELHLWTGKNYSAGGYTYLMKFANNKVTVSSDIASPDRKTTSSYDVIADQGPVLTVNTFNEIFHLLAQPSMDDDDGEQMDYEFVITRTTNDSICLRGKKWGNHMVMTRIPDNTSWADEISKIKNMESSMMVSYKLMDGTDTLGDIKLSNGRMLTYTRKDGNYSNIPYYVSTTGIVLAQPLTANDKTVQNLDYDANSMSLTSRDAGAKGLTFAVDLPKDWMAYNDFAGDYTMTTNWGTRKVILRLVPAGDGSTYLLRGMNPNYDIVLTYSRATGRLSMNTQKLCDVGGNQLWLCSWNAFGKGYFTWSTDAGMTLSRDTSKEGTVLKLASNDYTGLTTDSYILMFFSGTPSSSTRVGSAKGQSDYYMACGDYRLLGPQAMTKVK